MRFCGAVGSHAPAKIRASQSGSSCSNVGRGVCVGGGPKHPNCLRLLVGERGCLPAPATLSLDEGGRGALLGSASWEDAEGLLPNSSLNYPASPCSEDALAEFKSGPGKELAEAMLENKKALRAAKLRQKVCPRRSLALGGHLGRPRPSSLPSTLTGLCKIYLSTCQLAELLPATSPYCHYQTLKDSKAANPITLHTVRIGPLRRALMSSSLAGLSGNFPDNQRHQERDRQPQGGSRGRAKLRRRGKRRPPPP